jgi:(E)-4-hydroxy-3-methyl-but-2-enyl pyrophosphate reductase
MQITLAQHSGFCFGVKRAIHMALEASDKQRPIYTLGSLIHSPQMVQELSEHGVMLADKPETLFNSTVIVRSHGITLQDKETLIKNGNTLIDATCPYVSKAQDFVSKLCAEGYPVIILGDKDHPEVIAMLSYCRGETYVVSKPAELPNKVWSKLGIISQTTKSMVMLQNLVSSVLPNVKELKLYNTICTATSLRQEASMALAKKSDLMIVIGGRSSSNTKMLAALCGDITQTIHVETANELSAEQIGSHQNIGLTAGASTPDYLIVDVFNKINQLTGNRTSVNNVQDIPVNKEESC